MPALERKKSYGPPLSGLNDILDVKVIGDDDASECINARLNFHGIEEKFPGYVLDGSPFPNNTDSFIRTMFNFKRGTSVDWLLVAAQDDGNTNGTYKVDFKYTIGDGNYTYIGYTVGTATFITGNTAVTGIGTVWNTTTGNLKPGDKIKLASDPDSAYTEIASVISDTSLTLVAGGYLGTTSGGSSPYIARVILSANSTPAATVFDDLAIITNGTEVLMSYDSTTLQLIHTFQTAFSQPSAFFVESHKNRLFLGNTSGDPSNIYWSASFDPTAYDPAAFAPVFPQDNGSIVAIKSFGDSLIVVKDNGKLYQVIGNFDDDPGQPSFIRRIDYPEKTIGIIAGRSVTVHKGNIFFLAQGGWFMLDQRMVISKFTRGADNFISGVNFGAHGAQVAKSYPYTTNAQWDAGTFSGTTTYTNTLAPFFDLITITDCTQQNFGTSCVIDSNNTVHVVYVDTSGNLKHVSLDSNQSQVNEIVVPYSGTAMGGVAIDVSSSGLIGIVYRLNSSTLNFIEKSGGVWGSTQVVESTGLSSFSGNSLKYASDNFPRVAYSGPHTPLGVGIFYATKASGSFIVHKVASSQANSGGPLSAFGPNSSLAIASNGNIGISSWGVDNVHYVSPNFHLSLNFFISTNDGTSWTNIEQFDTGIVGSNPSSVSYTKSFMQLDTNSSNNFITGFCPVDSLGNLGQAFIARNHSTTTTTTLVSSTQTVGLGFRIGYSDDFFAYYTNNVSGGIEDYLFENSSTIGRSGSSLMYNGPGLTATNRGLSSNGQTFASVAYGGSSNQLLIRRIAFRSTWQSQQLSDASLSAWGLYSATDNGTASITYNIALTSAGPATVFNPITPGTVISSNATLTHAATRVDFLLTGFSQPVVNFIILNYTGAASGSDAKEAVAITFNNELYTACASTPTTHNNFVLSLDVLDAILKLTYAVNTLEVYKYQLWGGSSTNGDVYRLVQGLTFNGGTYAMDVQTKEYFLNSTAANYVDVNGLDLKKEFYKIYVLYNVQSSGTFTFSYRLDNFATPGGSPWVTQTINLDGSNSESPGIAEISFAGTLFRSIQFRHQNNEAGTLPQIVAIVVVYGYGNQR